MLRAARKYIREVSRLTKPRSYELGEELLLWDFRKGETLAQWDCISDREVKGNSFASFQPNGKGSGAMFHGYLSTELPSNNAAKHSGYCAIRSRPKKSSWFESGRFNVSEFDAFELKVRGDGRRFIANVQAPDLGRKDDVWQQFVFTQGGPEWEHIRLGFGDFFVTHRGYMQDQQMSFPRENVSTFGLLLADRINGPFSLEIQYIKAIRTLVPTARESTLFY